MLRNSFLIYFYLDINVQDNNKVDILRITKPGDAIEILASVFSNIRPALL